MKLPIIKAHSLVKSSESAESFFSSMLFFSMGGQIQDKEFILGLDHAFAFHMRYTHTFKDRGAMCDEYVSVGELDEVIVRFYHLTGDNPSGRDQKCSLCNGCVKETRGWKQVNGYSWMVAGHVDERNPHF